MNEKKTITVLIPKYVKPREIYPKCLWNENSFCWQRIGNSFSVREYKVPEPKECAACLGAFINWGVAAIRRPMHKAEITKEKEVNKAKESA